MRILYVRRKFSESSLRVIDQANAICEIYASQGYDLTLRQLFYQFVSRDLLPNTQRDYKRLGSIINDARLAGYIDWDYIVDRTRNVEIPASWENPAQIVEAAADSYRIDRWEGQRYRVEVWVEKEALAGVVERAAEVHRVPTFSCRGYVSQSELWGAAQRLGGYIAQGQIPVILHLGDHDPSGIDMTRDIYDRLETFMLTDFYQAEPGGRSSRYSDVKERMAEGLGAASFDMPVIVDRIALNMAQIEQYDPPPNPAKFTDARAEGYVQRFGHESWELDALEPQVLSDLIQDTIEDKYLDPDIWDETMRREADERAALRAIVDSLGSTEEE